MNCRLLFRQLARRARSFALPNAGNNRPARIAMIAMTTKSSISVNARRPKHRCDVRERMTMRNFQFGYLTAASTVWQMVSPNGLVHGTARSRRSADSHVRAVIGQNLGKHADKAVRAPPAR